MKYLFCSLLLLCSCDTKTDMDTPPEGVIYHSAPGAIIGGPVGAMNQEVPLTLQEIQEMSQSGTPDDEIIARIKETETTFSLTPSEIKLLKQNGVSQKVIDALNQR